MYGKLLFNPGAMKNSVKKLPEKILNANSVCLILRHVVNNPSVKDAVIASEVERYVTATRQRASRNEPEQLADAAAAPE